MSDLPAPLLGCLYCHSEGTIIQSENRRLFGIGEAMPNITCNVCGSVAVLEHNEVKDWRIRYKKTNRDREYFFSSIYLGRAGWMDANTALEISTMSFVQRQRVQQSRRGDLSWLKPITLDPPPPLIDPTEIIYLQFRYVTYQQGQRGRFSRADDAIVDSGSFYITDDYLHLLGTKRSWNTKLTDIRKVDFDDEAWYVYLKNNELNEYYRGDNPEEPTIMDAQLVASVIQALRGKAGG